MLATWLINHLMCGISVGLPKGQFFYVITLDQQVIHRQTRVINIYEKYLLNQGYPKTLVKRQFLKAWAIPRDDLLLPRTRENRKLFPLVMTLNPHLPNIGYVIRKHLHLLQSNPKLREFFPSNSIIPSFRRTKNLKEILAPLKYRTRVEQETNETGGCIKCKRSRYDLCKNVLIESNFLQSFQTNRKYFIKRRLSYDSKNVIYLASCNKCRLQYVGSTATQFKVRFRNHKSSMVTNKKTCEVAVHYNNSPHALNDFSFQCIDQVSATNCTEILDKLLITKEAYWSAQRFSLAPFGLNKRQEFHSRNRITYNQPTT